MCNRWVFCQTGGGGSRDGKYFVLEKWKVSHLGYGAQVTLVDRNGCDMYDVQFSAVFMKFAIRKSSIAKGAVFVYVITI